jgi:hypothetical protein
LQTVRRERALGLQRGSVAVKAPAKKPATKAAAKKATKASSR